VEEKVSEETDPATEVVALAKAMTSHQVRGSQGTFVTIAQFFNVHPDSAELFLIIATLRRRFTDLGDHVRSLDFDAESQQDLLDLIDEVQGAFSIQNLTSNTWERVVANAFKLSNITPFRFLSPMLKQKGIKWPVLSEAEQKEISQEVSTLLLWLKEQQLVDQDFIRQSLIEGLEGFQFRLDRMKLFGWGYSIESLRAVLSAYIALERGNLDPGSNPIEAALVRKVGDALSSIFEKLKVAREAVSTAGDLVKWYGAADLLLKGASVSALITG
jgi:hypothetical protein